MARVVAAHIGRPSPEDDLNAALLRDLGALLIQQTFPKAWAAVPKPEDPLGDEVCVREREVFGIDHAEVGAEALRRWGLPDDVVEPIRHHHCPERLADTPHAGRAELLWFAGLLARIDALIEQPEALDRVLDVATRRFALPTARLADFMDKVRPKIDAFAEMIDRQIGRSPDYHSLLSAATDELWRLAPAGRA